MPADVSDKLTTIMSRGCYCDMIKVTF